MAEKLPPRILVEPNPDHYLNQDRETIRELRERIEQMKDENYNLRTKIKELEEEKFSITHHLQKELEDKTEETIALSSEIAKIEENSKKEREFLLKEHKEQLNYIQKARAAEEDNYKFQIQELQSELKNIKEFKEAKQFIDEELETLRREKDDLYRKLTLQQNTIEQHYRKEEEKLRSRHQEEIRQLEIDALNRARNLLSKEEQDVHNENMSLAADMNMQRKEVEEIKREKKKTLEENKQLKRELELVQNQMEECAAKQSEMQKTIKALKEKIKVLENTLTQITNETEKEKEMMVFDFNQQIQERDSELLNLRQQVKLRSKELKSLKALAQMILDQRSDVEQFFLESLEQIKEEVQKRMTAEGKLRKLPQIGNKTKAYSEKVELSDLDWEDRERVLRLLFAKMNAGVPPQNWRGD
ncbi:CCDC176 [Blepharisma stoltei]|uniref:Uncharacterized protein n=1 Tax=Blepharisma stoltei TaxID=1481888 RepID=A0AAU9JIL3_9CILI|nr:unnamed protein product [Blepharisma stoltei]